MWYETILLESYLDVALKYGLPSGGLLQSWAKNFCEKASKGFHKKERTTFDVQENEINSAQEVHNMGFSIRMRKRIRGRLGLKGSKFIRKSRRYDSYKGIIGQVAKNRIHWRFYTSIPHQKENFFGLLKKAMYYGAIYTNFEQWNQAINEWIHYYNHRRLKTKLGCSPIQHRERMTA